MRRFRRNRQQAPAQQGRTGAGRERPRLPQRMKDAEREIRALRRRLKQVEDEVLESRQLNRQVAEMIDVIGEVLLPAGDRDEERLHALLRKYDSSL